MTPNNHTITTFLLGKKTGWTSIFQQISLLGAFILLMPLSGWGQSPPPAPCLDGSEATCACSTAPILCSIDDLDGFEYSMSTFQHPADGPNPLCSDNQNVPNNPTWFAFIAWCEDLTLNVEISNCSNVCNGSNGTPCGFSCFFFCTVGVQVAIYSDCSFSDQVACNTNDCGNEDDKLLEMSGLTIGQTYYFLVDGCAGSSCDVRINVVGTCGSAQIEPWSNPIDGPDRICLGNSGTYLVDDLQAATNYHWFLDGNEIAVTSTPTLPIDWNEEGIFQLCVDVSNNPCIPIEDDPEPICMTIIVADVIPQDPEPAEVCIGELYYYEDDGNFYAPGVYEIVLEAAGGCDSIITLIVDNVEVPVVDLGLFYLCSGEEIEIGGGIYSETGTYSLLLQQESFPFCDSIVEFLIVPIEADAGEIIAEPNSACPGSTISLSVINNAQSSENEQFIIVTDLDGAVLEFNSGEQLSFTSDSCASYLVYSYNYENNSGNSPPFQGSFFGSSFCFMGCCDIEVLEISFENDVPPTFTSPPVDITLEDVEQMSDISALSWTDACGGTGMVMGIETGSSNLCEGGLFTRTWTVADICGNLSSHEQSIVILPNEAACVDPCTLVFSNLEISNCDNNNTGFDNEDDFFSASFIVEATEGEVTTYIITWNGMVFGPFAYGERVQIDNLPANGAEIVLQVRDEENVVCRLDIPVSQEPCSSCDQEISAGEGGIITCADPTVTLTGSASEDGAFTWSGPDGFSSDQPIISVQQPGTYILSVAFPFQCVFTDEVVVTEDAGIPTADAGEDKILTCDIMEVILDGSGSSQEEGFRYEWVDESGVVIGTDLILSVTRPGVYNLRVFDDAIGCVSSPSSVVVGEDVDIPSAVIYADPGDQINCVIDFITLSSDEQDDVVLTWFINDLQLQQNTLVVTAANAVTLVALDTINGCSNENEIIIEDLVAYPVIDIEAPQPLSCTAASVLINAESSQSGNDIIHRWIHPDGSILLENELSLVVSEPGVYTLISIDTINGCENNKVIEVFDISSYIEVDAGEDLFFTCLDVIMDIQLQASLVNEPQNLDIQWSSNTGIIQQGEKTLTPIVEGTGTYTIRVENLDNGCVSLDSIVVLIGSDAPSISTIQVDSIFCIGDRGSILLTDFQIGNPPFDILLNGESTDNSGLFVSLQPGSYQINIIDALGCSADTIITLHEGRSMEVEILSEIFMDSGDTALLEAITNISEAELGLIQWTPIDFVLCPNCLTTRIIPLASGDFSILVIDQNGCEARASTTVIVRNRVRVFVPNGFTPNGDGINDYFTLFSDHNVRSIKEATVYDRWGNQLFFREGFSANDPELGWDGTFRGQPVRPGVYVYYFLVEFENGWTETYYGDVTVLD